MFKKISVVLSVLCVMPSLCFGITLKSRELGESAGAYYSDYDYSAMDIVPGADGMSEMEVIQSLRHDIQVLDEEIAACDRKRKGWVAATVIGGVGVVGTGIAALVQNSKIQEKKSELNQVKTSVEETNRQITEAKNTK